MIDVDKINELYNTRYFVCELSRDLIEEALLEKFDSFGYFKYYFHFPHDETRYVAGAKFEWESYVYESEGSTREEALSNLLIENSDNSDFIELVRELGKEGRV